MPKYFSCRDGRSSMPLCGIRVQEKSEPPGENRCRQSSDRNGTCSPADDGIDSANTFLVRRAWAMRCKSRSKRISCVTTSLDTGDRIDGRDTKDGASHCHAKSASCHVHTVLLCSPAVKPRPWLRQHVGHRSGRADHRWPGR